MEFYVPTDTGEFLAFCGALAALLLGLVGLFAPRLSLRFSGLQLREGSTEGCAAARSLGGFHAGLALAAALEMSPAERGKAVCLVTGGSIDADKLAHILTD